jgi:hypothetical protein
MRSYRRTQIAASLAALLLTASFANAREADHNQNGLHRQKSLTPNLVKAMLQYSAIPVAGANYLTQGAGGINAAGAIALAKVIDTSAAAGAWWLSTGVTPVSEIGSEAYPWSRQIIWADDVLTEDLLYYNAPPWSVTAQWGADDIVWGTDGSVVADDIVWGTAVEWVPNLVWPDRVVGQLDEVDNIVWGTGYDSIVWGTLDRDDIIWGAWNGGNIIWGTWDGDNIVWGTTDDDNIVWGTNLDDIIWGTYDDIIWSTAGAF